MEKLNIQIDNMQIIQHIIGANDVNLKAIMNILGTKIYVRNDEFFVEDVGQADVVTNILLILIELTDNNIYLVERDVVYLTKVINKYSKEDLLTFFIERKALIKNFQGKYIYPKSFSQQSFIDALTNNDIIIAQGAAGTGKTYLAIAYAILKLKDNSYKKIILTRPVVEAGESLGFLPGDLKEKIDPYLRPLYDALHDIIGVKQTDEYLQKGIIEIAPLAYMRGRTLENAYVILDEAQNTTINQIKLFLTRLGFNSKMVITGDLTQVDLPNSKRSGLKLIIDILRNINQLAICNFSIDDVVRNPIVQAILRRFEEYENKS